ncbi:class GN sortase [Paraferrimonas sedimenticola]|uniref:Class GN sortase n=1 Tax=Paraferrimonas sedimenticola TaxID=375674 RepID=A0AA37RYV5_9GAMM|nr:class GN sortase [Paraferrimonas sedimenticola]GLP97910.1 class GN sortase [Paraferrimonas sedimenticola]
MSRKQVSHQNKRRKQLVGLALTLTVGIGLMFNGGYLQAKAYAAQWLLESAWQQQLETGKATKPWSWADTHPVAKLSFPDTQQSLLVLAGASGRNLAFGPGLWLGQASNSQANKVVFGHKDTHFAGLETLKVDDRIQWLGADRQVEDYLVESIQVVHQSRGDLLGQVGEERLQLVTCYPFDATSVGGELRYLVTAKRVYPVVARVDIDELRPREYRF